MSISRRELLKVFAAASLVSGCGSSSDQNTDANTLPDNSRVPASPEPHSPDARPVSLDLPDGWDYPANTDLMP